MPSPSRFGEMARYFFHLHDDSDVPDTTGQELPHVEAALAQAMAYARFEVGEMARRDGRIVLSHRIDIEDDQHHVVDTVSFGDVLQVEL